MSITVILPVVINVIYYYYASLFARYADSVEFIKRKKHYRVTQLSIYNLIIIL